MSGTNDELNVARGALVKARGDLMRQLVAEPAWHALRQLEARKTGRGTSRADTVAATRTELHARLDASVPKWRTIADIEAAIAALDASRPGAHMRGDLPPPPPVSRQHGAETPVVPHVRIEPERTRFASQTRPAAAAPRQPDIVTPINARQSLRRVDAGPVTASHRKADTATGRLAAALGLVGEGPARLSAIESEVERLMRRDAGTWEAPPVAPPASARPDRATHEPTLHLPDIGEEAEVEIIQLGTAPVRETRRPLSKLADRLSRVAGGDDDQRERVISMQAGIEDASVEIDIPSPAAPAPLMLTHEDADVPKP